MLTIDIDKAKTAKARLEQEKLDREERNKRALEAKINFDQKQRMLNKCSKVNSFNTIFCSVEIQK